MTEPIIQTFGLTKYYGRRLALADVSLEVTEGEVFGYLGPNGAGKTTTLRLLMDFIRPSAGRAVVLGMDPRRHGPRLRRQMGYLPSDPALDGGMTGRQLLRYYAHLRGGADWGYVARLAEALDCDLDRRVRSLSRGNRQKLAILLAFMHRPRLLVLDEPTTGLDPLIQHRFHELVREAAHEGRTVFLSSHNLAEVERVCHRVAIIRQGRLIAVEEVSALKERSVHRWEVQLAGPVSAEVFRRVPGVREVAVEGAVVRLAVVGRPDALIKALAHFQVERVVTREVDLEEVFLSFYGEGGAPSEGVGGVARAAGVGEDVSGVS